MYKHEFQFTVFVNHKESLIERGLKGLRFRKKGDSFTLDMDCTYFHVVPFQHQPRSSLNGYRCYCNGSIEGATYLLDTSFGWTDPEVTGILCTIKDDDKTQEDWIHHLQNHVHCHMVDARGLFRYKKTMVSIVPEGICLHLHAPKGKKLDTLKSLQEIDSMRENISPLKYDLFSFLEEEDAV
ncbi:hypothetical protein [Gracilibacillus sp. YIM 98692]|uniref:hypothetical protein n=1 Tax=Gracilibacillus sp. YIM 98692 TaxID=2663532 RepID=UPI0013D87158|nr:hypothetical protein [Gracilibacillus sp. YIM 98692]